jgi:hypothetical protein
MPTISPGLERRRNTGEPARREVIAISLDSFSLTILTLRLVHFITRLNLFLKIPSSKTHHSLLSNMAPNHIYSQVPQTLDIGDSAEEKLGDDYDKGLKPGRRLLFTSPILIMALLSSLSLLFGIVIGALFAPAIMKWLAHHYSSNDMPVAGTVAMIDGVDTPGTQCGDSWQEAKELGCHFDVMASRWYAPECFDQAALEGMLEEQPYVNFTWYADKEHTKIYPSELVLRGEFDKVYPSGDYHIYHCLYLWRRLHHAVLKNKPVDEDLFRYGHTLHCTRMIMRWMDPSIPRTTISSATSGTPFCKSTRLGVLA